MNLNRKEFLKLTAISTVFGVGGGTAISALANPKLFASEHDSGETEGKVRWGLAIDMSKCESGCTKCSDTCHAIHNVPKVDNKKHEIKWLWKEKFGALFPEDETPFMAEEAKEQEYLTLCNQCKNPPCVRVCPTQATFKRDKDGIVMMDYHRCIGCRFCMAGCPYGSRSFNFEVPRKYLDPEKIDLHYPTRTKGVVEKCTLCYERIDQGGKPACVEACDKGAIVFGDLNDPNSEIRAVIRKNHTMRRKSELGTNPSVFYKM